VLKAVEGNEGGHMADILIIDDEEMIRESLSTLFVREGFTVEVAINGDDGLAKFVASPARLVIVDIVMPEKEGVATIQELRRSDPDLGIIAISGGGRRGNIQFLDVARKMGADAALAKPFTRSQITGLVREMLGARA
jgi:DNA-binding NtrC family response regulator